MRHYYGIVWGSYGVAYDEDGVQIGTLHVFDSKQDRDEWAMGGYAGLASEGPVREEIKSKAKIVREARSKQRDRWYGADDWSDGSLGGRGGPSSWIYHPEGIVEWHMVHSLVRGTPRDDRSEEIKRKGELQRAAIDLADYRTEIGHIYQELLEEGAEYVLERRDALQEARC